MAFRCKTLPDDRRTSVTGASGTVKFYVTAAVCVAMVTIVAIVVLAVVVPMNTTVIATVIGVTFPIISSLMGGALHSMAVSVDGRLSQLLLVTGEKEHAQGQIEGLRENPKTNI